MVQFYMYCSLVNTLLLCDIVLMSCCQLGRVGVGRCFAEFSTFMCYCVCSAALGFLMEGVEFDFLNCSVRFFSDVGSSL